MLNQKLLFFTVLLGCLLSTTSGKSKEENDAEHRGSPEPVRKGFDIRPVITQEISKLQVSVFDDIAESELKKKKLIEKLDRANLLNRSSSVIERSEKMLKQPKFVKDLGEFVIAKEPPVVELNIIPVKHRYLPEPKEGCQIGIWSTWCPGVYHPVNRKFYGSIGNHRRHQAEVFIIEYDTLTKTIHTSQELNEFLGRSPNGFGDGKVHGYLDIYNGTELFFATYWCHVPEPTEEDYATGYKGGHILSYDVFSSELKDHGVPLYRSTWPFHKMDTVRGLFYGVGMFSEFVCYDINSRQRHWAGFLPEEQGLRWFPRCMVVDEETGFVYSSNMSRSDTEVHMIKYDPYKNRFFRMSCTVPANSQTGERGQLRAYTRRKTKEGYFVCIALGGELFKFYPDMDHTEGLGLCWNGPHRYTTNVALSPDEKYVYYVPSAHGRSYLEGTPIIQYNLRTNEKKVLAFLTPYFHEKYNYLPSGTFGVTLDDKGERLFIVFNGGFEEFDFEQVSGGNGRLPSRDILGCPSACLVHIPQSERQ